MPNAIHFFATRSDILQVLDALEASAALKYVETGSFTVPNALAFETARAIPALGTASAGDLNHIPHFMVMPFGHEVTPETVAQRGGGVRYIIRHVDHPGSITFVSGGQFGGDVLISGEFGTSFASGGSRELFRKARTAVRREFLHVKSYWVGPEATALWRTGWRLTSSVRSPREYDLTD
jgi:hypothetical protein